MQSKYDEYDYDYEEALSVDSFAAVPAAAIARDESLEC